MHSNRPSLDLGQLEVAGNPDLYASDCVGVGVKDVGDIHFYEPL